MTKLRYIFALLILIALPGHLAAEELSKESCPLFRGRSEAFRGLPEWQAVSSEGSAVLCATEDPKGSGMEFYGMERRESTASIDSTHILLADSLHRLTAIELHELSQPTEIVDPAMYDSLSVYSERSLQRVASMASRTERGERSALRDGVVGARRAGAFQAKREGTDPLASPTRRQLRQQRLATFMPDPARATWSALVFPGGGQIYNHKYWKLPIVYGGFLGCAYALNWNNQMYSDYSQAYLDIMDDDPGTASYEDFLPPRYNVEANKDYLKRVFKNRKDNYRRQRDLSIFCFIGVYLLSVVDAYVDAELSNFDITDDLSVQVRPTTISNQQQTLRNQAYGLQCSFSF